MLFRSFQASVGPFVGHSVLKHSTGSISWPIGWSITDIRQFKRLPVLMRWQHAKYSGTCIHILCNVFRLDPGTCILCRSCLSTSGERLSNFQGLRFRCPLYTRDPLLVACSSWDALLVPHLYTGSTSGQPRPHPSRVCWLTCCPVSHTTYI